MSCEEVREELVALLDEELPHEARERVQAHLESCTDCSREHLALQKAQALVGDALRSTEPATARFEELWAARDPKPRLGAASRAPGRHASARGGRRRATAWAAAAAVVVAVFAYRLLPGSSAPTETEVAGLAPAGARPVAVAAAPVAIPDELRRNPDMFVDFVIVRRLEKLRQLPDLLGERGRDSSVGRT